MAKKEHDINRQIDDHAFETANTGIECFDKDTSNGYVELAGENGNNDGSNCCEETYDSTLSCPKKALTENIYNQFEGNKNWNESDMYNETLPSHNPFQTDNEYGDIKNNGDYNTCKSEIKFRSKNDLIYDN